MARPVSPGARSLSGAPRVVPGPPLPQTPTAGPTQMGSRELVARLAVTLVGLIALGWLSGLILVHLAGRVVSAHLDQPTRRLFTAHGTARGRHLMGWLTLMGADRVTAPGALVLGSIWRWRRRSWVALQALVLAYLGGTVLAIVVKALVERGRPHGFDLRALSGYSYPSGHALSAAAVWGTAGFMFLHAGGPRILRAVGAGVAIVVIPVVAVSRLYLGVHWLTDVVAGVAIGGAWAFALDTVAGRCWPSRRTLIALPTPSARWTRRIQSGCLAGAGLAVVAAASYSLGPLTESGPANSELACGTALEVLLGRGPAREGHPPPALSQACVHDAELQLAASGAGLVTSAILLTVAFHTDRLRRRVR